jgi:hypothetical protein
MVFELGRIERPGQTCLFIIVAGPLPEARPPYSSRAVAANQAAGGILSHDVIDHQIARWFIQNIKLIKSTCCLMQPYLRQRLGQQLTATPCVTPASKFAAQLKPLKPKSDI